MNSAYFTIHPGKYHPPQNSCRLKSVFFLRSTGFTPSTFPIQPDLSQNQPAAITLNTGSPRTLLSTMWILFGDKPARVLIRFFSHCLLFWPFCLGTKENLHPFNSGISIFMWIFMWHVGFVECLLPMSTGCQARDLEDWTLKSLWCGTKCASRRSSRLHGSKP